jgi:aminomethyltransferase
MLKKSAFFDFLNRHRDIDFEAYLKQTTQDEDYIDWHHFVLPNDYGDAEQEYRAIRGCCAMFDASPIRKYRIRGSGAGSFLDYLLTRRVSQSPSMRGIYVAYCNENGSLKDDSILYKYSDEDYLLMPADIDHDAYFESLRQRLEQSDVSIVECSDSLVGIALQGPMSASLLDRWGLEGIERLEPFEVRKYSLGTGAMHVSRMGFTADLGYECWFEPALSDAFQRGIVETSESMSIEVPGYGLSALEACRLEGGLIVPGWDCSTEADPNPDLERTPFELGIGWLVELDERDFVGRNALMEQKQNGHRFVRRSFEMKTEDKPAEGSELHATVDGEDCVVGTVTCSSWSWGLERMIGSASILRRFMRLEGAWALVGDERVMVKLERGSLIDLKRRSQVPAPIQDTGPEAPLGRRRLSPL